jgi:4-amino-4-deoxy-L-arabinose transferase-like glycosyltransferase
MAVGAQAAATYVMGRHLHMALDVAGSSHVRAILVLILVGLLNFVPGLFTIPPVDRDEARFAQATKQMLESGDYVDIRFQNEARYKKPIGIYWMQAAAVQAASAFGIAQPLDKIWIYRIPSLLGALGAVLLTYWTALAFVRRRAAVLAALMLAASVLLAVVARLATTDGMLLLTVVAAMGAMARVYLPAQRAQLGGVSNVVVPLIFWTALAAGILLKGPVIVMVAGFCIATLSIADRSAVWLGALRPLPGLIWLCILTLPWFIAISMRSDQTFLASSVGRDLLPRLYRVWEEHGAPPGTYYLLFWLTFFPGSVLVALAAPACFSMRKERGTKFLLAWLVPSWLALELFMTKLPHYVLPLYPAIAILTAKVMEAGLLSRSLWLVRVTAWWFVLPLLLGIAAVAGVVMVGHQFAWPTWVLVGGAVAVGFSAWWFYDTDAAEPALMRSVAAAVLITIGIFGLFIPRWERLFPAPMLARILDDGGCARPVAVASGYEEPSLVFLTATATRFTTPAQAADFLGGGACRFAFIDAELDWYFKARAEAIGLRYKAEPRINAISISKGKSVTIAVYRSEGGS